MHEQPGLIHCEWFAFMYNTIVYQSLIVTAGHSLLLLAVDQLTLVKETSQKVFINTEILFWCDDSVHNKGNN